MNSVLAFSAAGLAAELKFAQEVKERKMIRAARKWLENEPSMSLLVTCKEAWRLAMRLGNRRVFLL